MIRIVNITLISFLCLCSFAWAQKKAKDDNHPAKPQEIEKIIDLGSLGEYFDLVSATRMARDDSRPTMTSSKYGDASITLKLQAKKDVDTSRCFFKAGFFDNNNHLCHACDVVFEAKFPLIKGESVNVLLYDGGKQTAWGKIAVRKNEGQTYLVPPPPTSLPATPVPVPR